MHVPILEKFILTSIYFSGLTSVPDNMPHRANVESMFSQCWANEACYLEFHILPNNTVVCKRGMYTDMSMWKFNFPGLYFSDLQVSCQVLPNNMVVRERYIYAEMSTQKSNVIVPTFFSLGATGVVPCPA